MKRIVLALTAIICALICAMGFVACSNENDGNNDGHVHTFDTKWSSDAEFHWHSATCEHTGEVQDKARHVFNGQICKVCYAIASDAPITDGLSYTEIKEKGETIGYSVSVGEALKNTYIKIPSTHNNKPVTSIAQNGFSGCNNLICIEIPKSVTVIGEGAFAGCIKIVVIVIHAGVTNIGSGAFDGCDGLTRIDVAEGNTNYSSEDGILYNKAKTEFVHVPKLVTGTVTIPTSITTIPNVIFVGRIKIAVIIIHAGVTNIGSGAFSGCDGLTRIDVAEGNTNYSSEDGILYNKAKTEFVHVPKLVTGTVTIPTSITTIPNVIFVGRIKIAVIIIHAGVTNIGSDAFSGCDGLTRIDVAEGNTNYSSEDGILYNKAKTEFVHVPKLVTGTVTIPTGITTVPNGIFNGCIKIAVIIIHAGVTNIGSGAFSGCGGLTRIDVAEGNTNYSSEDGILYNKAKTEFVHVPKLVTGTVTIPTSITIIPEGRFAGCVDLIAIVIHIGVTNIGNEAFSGCSCLTIYCEALNAPSDWGTWWNLNCPIVWNCNNNSRDENGYEYAAIGGILYRFKDGEATVMKQPSSTSGSIVIPSSVTYKNESYTVTAIGSNAFRGCVGLTSITIPSGVTTIRGSAFEYCSSLTSITIPDGVTHIGGGAFAYCSGLTSITIPNSVTEIGEGAFCGCSSLTSIAIPSGVTEIGDVAFALCSSLTSITIPDGVTELGSGMFQDCSSLTSITLPDGITNIDGYVFDGCDSMEFETEGGVRYFGKWAIGCDPSAQSVSLRADTVGIAGRAFNGCAYLTSITIPSGVKYICEKAFYGCSRLTSIVIPKSVTFVSHFDVFAGCDNLTINCEAEEQPDGWEEGWNEWHYREDDWRYGKCPVVWGYVKQD